MKTYTFSSFKLELLHVNGDLDYGILSYRLEDLVWFRWENCPHISIDLPEINNLRVLELVKGNLETLFQLPAQLREVRVKKCRELVEIPPAFESLIQLEKMTLIGCVKLEILPQQLCQLQALKHLELRKCESLTSLPDQFFGELTNLVHIDFSDCENLSQLPRSFGQLSQLKYLELRNCRNLMIHPELFEEINSLEQLGFENCRNLRHLPTQTTCQVFLRKLNLLGTSLEQLPNDIDQWTKLELLYIESPFLTSLPLCLGNMRCVTQLVLFNCP
ncbi:hypothetical protein KI387_040292 [Taxus chinensis]|uniref:Uncharacterized protein n=1 Tax=Taxus chinensis TaxID=29808 RepID=A0AA38CCJ1_TAXCH|nr:hypothetical protein KI387_040292 [Taxus chinensis]